MTTDAEPVPVRRAIVSLRGGDRPLGRHAITDDEGRFVFDALPAGRYNISATRESFVTIPHGATRPGRPAAPLIVEAGQQLDNIRVWLARGAVITGTVRDESGEPIPSLDVRVELRAARTTKPAATVVKTDDQGVYRAFGLAAGEYFVSARPPAEMGRAIVPRADGEVDARLRALQQRRASTQPATVVPRPSVSNQAELAEASASRTSSFVPVFHPSAFTLDDAAPVTVGAGDTRGGVDITLRLMTMSRVAGRIVDMNSRAPKDIEVGLTIAGATTPSGTQRTRVGADGAFEFSAVAPGRYLLSARALSPELAAAAIGRSEPVSRTSATTAPCAFAAQELRVLGDPVVGATLTLRPCLTIAGRVLFTESATLRPPETLAGLRISLEPAASTGVPTLVPWRVPATVNAESRFVLGEFGDVTPGQYHLSVDLPGSQPGRGWTLQSATVDGQDILDAPLHIAPDAPSVSTLVVTFTDQHASLSGVLEAAARRPATDYTMLVFTTNRDWWRAPFRRVRTARPAAAGQYMFQDLPPGEYYLAALTELAPDDWRDPDFLEQVVGAAIRVTVGPGEQKVQGLRIGGGTP